MMVNNINIVVPIMEIPPMMYGAGALKYLGNLDSGILLLVKISDKAAINQYTPIEIPPTSKNHIIALLPKSPRIVDTIKTNTRANVGVPYFG
jgi:hypothetical protein